MKGMLLGSQVINSETALKSSEAKGLTTYNDHWFASEFWSIFFQTKQTFNDINYIRENVFLEDILRKHNLVKNIILESSEELKNYYILENQL